jgi:hypothetical protein
MLIFNQQPRNQWFQQFPKPFRSHQYVDLREVVPRCVIQLSEKVRGESFNLLRLRSARLIPALPERE